MTVFQCFASLPFLIWSWCRVLGPSVPCLQWSRFRPVDNINKTPNTRESTGRLPIYETTRLWNCPAVLFVLSLGETSTAAAVVRPVSFVKSRGYVYVLTRSSICYCRQVARRAVKLLSTIETSCTTNPQQNAVMKLEGCSSLTCSKQPRLVDCRIGVVNKLDRRRRRRRRVLLTARSTWRCEIFKVRSLGQSSRGK